MAAVLLAVSVFLTPLPLKQAVARMTATDLWSSHRSKTSAGSWSSVLVGPDRRVRIGGSRLSPHAVARAKM